MVLSSLRIVYINKLKKIVGIRELMQTKNVNGNKDMAEQEM